MRFLFSFSHIIDVTFLSFFDYYVFGFLILSGVVVVSRFTARSNFVDKRKLNIDLLSVHIFLPSISEVLLMMASMIRILLTLMGSFSFQCMVKIFVTIACSGRSFFIFLNRFFILFDMKIFYSIHLYTLYSSL